MLLFSILSFAQLNPFTVTTTVVNNETCPSNGSISWTVSGTDPSSILSYNIVNTSTNVSISTSATTYSGLTAGSYKIVATQTKGNESNQATSATVTIANSIIPLTYQVTTNAEICGNDGQVIIDVSQGRPSYTYQLQDTAGNVLQQYIGTGNTQAERYTFTGVAAGNYKVMVIDQCGQGVVKSVTVSSTPSKFSINDPGIYERITLSDDCSTFNFSYNLNLLAGNTIKFPLKSKITYTDNNGQPQTLNSVVDGISGGSCGTNYCNYQTYPSINLPFYAGSTNLPVRMELTDACGNVFTKDYTFDLSIRGNATTGNSTCGGKYITFNFFGIQPSSYTVAFTSAPANFDPALYNPNHGTMQSSHTYGSSTQPLPSGTYVMEVTDKCGRKQSYTEQISQATPFLYSFGYSACPEGGTVQDVSVPAGYYLAGMKITAAPAAFSQPLPYTVPTSDFYKNAPADTDYKGALLKLPPGNYTVEYTTACGPEIFTTSFTVQKYVNNSTVTVTKGCSSAKFDYDLNFSPNPYNNRAMMVQKYYPQYGQWSYVSSYSAPPATGLQPGNQLASGYYNYSGSITLSNLNPGKSRVITDFTYPTINSSQVQISELDCVKVLQEFEIGAAPVITNAYAFQCSANNYDVAVSASGGLAPLKYSLVSDDTSSATTLLDNGTQQIFHNLNGGTYFFRVTDACGNFVTRKLEVATLGKPGIKFSPDCATKSLKLSVEGLDYLSFQWYKASDPATILSTSNVLDLGTYDASKAGTYRVRMYTTNPTFCINNIEEIVVSPNAFTSGLAGTGQTITINYEPSMTQLNLFNYLTPPYDGYGKWTEVSGPSSNLLVNQYWNVGIASGGTYTFRYTVTSPCTGVVSTADVIINLIKTCYNPVTNTAAGTPVNHGITLLKRAGADNGNWPMNRNSAHTALESNTKGFVITRVPTSGLSAITNPVEGMMVYDTTAKCLKIYVVDNTTPANTGWKCFSTPSCP